MSSKISLCFICDEYYVMPTSVAITSVIVNKKCDIFYDIYVVTNNLSDESITMFKNMETESVRIIIIKADKCMDFDKFKIENYRVTPSALLKFQLPGLLPEELERVLYLDSDVIVQKDLAAIFNEDIETEYAGVVSDGLIGTKAFCDYYNIRCPSYFNAGVLLLNLKKMREEHVSELLLQHRNTHKTRLMDQDTFNIVLGKKVVYLSFYYNFQYHSWNESDIKQLTEHYGLKKVDSKYKWLPEAFIIHYSWRKPWEYFHYFASDIWFHYYLLSPFKNVALHRKLLDVKEYDKYKTVRIDMKNYGTADNNVVIKSCSDEAREVYSPGWFKDAKGSGVVLHSMQGYIELETKCLGDGNMRVALRGRDCRDNSGKRYPVWICVTRLRVDGKELINNPHLVWHDKPFVYNLQVTNEQIVKIYVEWQPAIDILAKEREKSKTENELKNESNAQQIRNLAEKLETLCKENNAYKLKLSNVEDKISRLQANFRSCERSTSEVVWAEIFNNVISDSSWLKNTAFSPGRYAVGYQYLYVMYRVLNEIRPQHILELGMGQTTRMIGQYVSSHEGTEHFVVEHDSEWINFFSRDFALSERSEIIKLDREMQPFKEAEAVRAFKGFEEQFSGKKFDFISIDAPLGLDMKHYSRIDVLKLLPDCLEDSFIIMIDDAERSGETNTVNAMKERLEQSGIAFVTGRYSGIKDCVVICSKNLKFVCSM